MNSAELSPAFTATPPAFVPEGHRVPAGQGAEWLKSGWRSFKQSPLAWIIATVIYVGISMLETLLPYFNLVVLLLNPLFIGGLMYACQRQLDTQRLDLADIATGISRAAGPLAVLGASAAGVAVASLLPVLLLGGASAAGAMLQGGQPDIFNASNKVLLLSGMGCSILISWLFTAALWASPALVMLHGMAPLAALRASFFAYWTNWRAALIYVLCAMILFCLGVLPLGLGLIVVLPLMLASIHASYRDIFFTP